MKIRTLTNFLMSRVRKSTITTIVLHGTGGASVDSSVNWLRISKNSYHFLIERKGEIIKAVPTTRVAFHAGKSSGPNGVIRNSVNDYSIGIAFGNFENGKEQLTAAQLRACEELISELCKNIPTRRWVTTHKAVAPKRKSDPIMFRKEMIKLPPSINWWL